MGLFVFSSGCLLPVAAQTGTVPLHKISEAHTASVAETGHAARLRGIVTGFSGWKNSFFLQDSTGAISVDRMENAAVQTGDEVEVTGQLRPGLFANVVLSERTVVLGHGELPKARPASYRELLTGGFDSSLVVVSGTVHATQRGTIWGRPMLTLNVQTGDSVITVYLLRDGGQSFDNLVDSSVRITGVCGTIFNSRRQLIGLRLFVEEPKQIEVLKRGEDLASIPISRIDRLLTFQGPPLDHRVRVRGTVTYQEAGRVVFVQQGKAAIRVLTSVGGALAPGVRAEAWGFVANRSYSAEMENGIVKAVGRDAPVQPIRIQATDVIKVENGFLQAPYDGLLVQLTAKVVDRLPNSGALLWTMEDNGMRFEAQIAEGPRDWAFAFESGADVLLSGICVAEIDQSKDLRSFHLLLRSPADMVILHAPYWNQSLLLLVATYLSILVGSLLVYLLQKWQFTGAVLAGEEDSGARTEEICRKLSKILAILTMVLGLGTFSEALTRISHPVMAMYGVRASGLNSGPLFFMAGLAIFLEHARRGAAAWTRGFCTWVVIGAGGLTLAGGMTQGRLLTGGLALMNAEQMSLSTELSFVLIGCGSLWSRSRRLADAGQVLGVMVAFTALLKLVSALYGAGTGNGLAAHLIMPAPSAVAFLLLGVALLTASPEVGLMKTVCSPRLGGLVLRRLIPAAVVMPVVLGMIRLELQVMGLFDTRFGLTLFAVSNAACFCFLIWASAAILNRLDAQKSKAEEGLREREQKLELIFEAGSLGDWVWNVADGMVSAHSSVWRLYGQPERRGVESIEWFRGRHHPEDREWVAVEFQRAQEQRCSVGIEFRVIWPDESIHWDYCRAVPVFDSHGKLVHVIGIDLDITRQKAVESTLKHSLDEKRVLLQEVHHRVKNNLSIISSLLSMQAETLQNQEAVNKLHDSRERVMSMAMIHEQLYRHDDMSSIDLANYVQELASQLFSSYAPSPLITYRVETQPASLSIEQSIPCGLILNELITNALKYAYPSGEGEVLIQVGEEKEEVWFAVSDEGVGMPKGFDWKTSKSLGMQIIHVLTDQLDGELEVGNGTGGASFTVRFAKSVAKAEK